MKMKIALGLSFLCVGLVVFLLALGRARAADSRTPQVYPMPAVTPGFAPDSAYRSLWPSQWLATPAPKETPPAASDDSKSRSSDSRSTGFYEAGTPQVRAVGTGSGFVSDQAPIVDPSTVPTEISFEPKKKESPAPSPSDR